MRYTIKVRYILLLIIITFTLGNVFSVAAKTTDWLDELVTIRFKDESLNLVLEEISKQTGIAILYEQDLATEKVTVNYKDVKVAAAIGRLFRAKNKSIQVNKKEKIIIVKTFGAKYFIRTGKVLYAQGKDSSAPATLTELRKLHNLQFKEFKDRIADDNEVLEGGLTRGELRAMHGQQYKAYQIQLDNDDRLLEQRITLGEVRATHKIQKQAYLLRLADDNEMLEGGMTRGELRGLHEKQFKGYRERLSDNSKQLEGGLTRLELREMHRQQGKKYKDSINAGSFIIN